MTPTEFRAWRLALGLTQSQAASLLGRTPRMIRYYEAGVKKDGQTIEIPKAVRLACWAIEHSPKKPPIS